MKPLMDEPDDDALNELFVKAFPTTPTLGSRCRDARRLINVSQKELAVLAGATFSDVSDLENSREAHDVNARVSVLCELVGLLADELRKARSA